MAKREQSTFATDMALRQASLYYQMWRECSVVASTLIRARRVTFEVYHYVIVNWLPWFSGAGNNGLEEFIKHPKIQVLLEYKDGLHEKTERVLSLFVEPVIE